MLFVVVFLIYLPLKRRRKYAVSRLFVKNHTINERGIDAMKELAARFIGKDVYIKLLEGTADGVVKEVTDDGIVLENKNGLQIINLNYVMKLREYPYKNGKRTTVWGE